MAKEQYLGTGRRKKSIARVRVMAGNGAITINGRDIEAVSYTHLDMESGGLSYAVLGMGINIKDPPGGWPEELAPVAGSLFGAAEPPRGVRNLIAAHILNGLAEEYRELESRRFLSEYRSRDVYKRQERYGLLYDEYQKLYEYFGAGGNDVMKALRRMK